MADTKLRFRIGLFLLIALIALGTLLYLFGLYPEVFRVKEGYLYYVDFSDAPGVVVNTPVRRSGVKIGQVEEVDLDNESGKVLVVMRVEKRYTLRRNEEPTLNSGLLSGDTTIDLVPKEPKRGVPEDRTVIDPGTRIDGRLAASVTRFLDRASAVVPPAQEALGRISNSLEKVEKLIPQFERTLEEYRLLARDARRSIPDVRQTSDEIQKLAREINRSMPNLRETNTAILKLIRDVNQIVPEIVKAAKGVNEAIPDVQRLAKGAADAVPEARKLIRDFNTDSSRLMKDINAVVPDVRALVKDVNAAVPEVRKLVKDIVDSVPMARDAIKEGAIALKNWGVAGERASVLIQTNEKVIGDIFKSIDQAVKNIDSTVGNINMAFSLENRNNIALILQKFAEGSRRFPGITDELELFLRQGRTTLKKVDEVFEQLNKTMQPGKEPSTGGIIKNFGEAVEKLNKTMTDVQEIVRVAGRSDGTLRRFIADPSLYNHADDAALMLTRLLPRIDRALKDLETFADKLARHPESIGLGGVVRPSSGIKDPPRSSNYPRP